MVRSPSKLMTIASPPTWASCLHPPNAAATVRQRDGREATSDQLIAAIIEAPFRKRRRKKTGPYELHQMTRSSVMLASQEERGKERRKKNWPTFNSIPKWYDAVCQSVGEASDITTPGQQRTHASRKWVQASDSLSLNQVTHSADRPV